MIPAQRKSGASVPAPPVKLTYGDMGIMVTTRMGELVFKAHQRVLDYMNPLPPWHSREFRIRFNRLNEPEIWCGPAYTMWTGELSMLRKKAWDAGSIIAGEQEKAGWFFTVVCSIDDMLRMGNALHEVALDNGMYIELGQKFYAHFRSCNVESPVGSDLHTQIFEDMSRAMPVHFEIVAAPIAPSRKRAREDSF